MKQRFLLSGNMQKIEMWVYFLLFFLFSFGFFLISDYIIFFQEQQYLFVYLSDFLRGFFLKPGGILDLAGKFLTQFYYNNLIGSAVLSLVLVLNSVVIYFVSRRLNGKNIFSPITALIPSFLLLLMQSHYYHSMTYNLGYLFVVLYFLLAILPSGRIYRLLILSCFPLFYYVTGFYAFVFSVLFLIYTIIYFKGKDKLIFSLFILAVTLLTYYFSARFVFLQPSKDLIIFPYPSVANSTHRYLTVILTAYLISIPLITYLSGISKQVRKNNFLLRVAVIVIFFILTGYILKSGYNPDVERVINMERLVFDEKWEEAVDYFEKNPARNLIGQYFYNVALSESGQLCDRMFSIPQDFGVKSLFLPWDDEHLQWGALAFYAVGLINEAHRWVYEEMVVYGCRPQNIKMLVRTNLINRKYRMAEKYTKILKRTLNYRKWAMNYESLLYDTTALKNHPVLGNKVEIIPEENFFIYLESPHENLPLLVEVNSLNKAAFEYLMAWLLLSRDVETAVTNIPVMKKLGYSRIPVHIEEAVMIYYNSTGKMPDLAGFIISAGTKERFKQYVSAYSSLKRKNALRKENMQSEFGKSYWFYYHFIKKS